MARGSKVSEAILNLFVNLQAVGETFWDFTYHPYSYIYKSLSDEMGYKEASIRSALSRLQKKGFLELDKSGRGEMFLNLSNEGKAAWLSKKLKSEKLPKLSNQYVLVVFDIPEAERKIRDLLRQRLRQFGFEPWQKSVWATDNDVFHLIKRYFDQAALGDYVIILQSAKSNRSS